MEYHDVKKPAISVLLLTLNEERNLGPCLDSVDWCDDVIVVDSGSRDGTVALAAERGARILERPFDTFAAQRNYGLEHGQPRHEWVLHLDADERVTEALRREMLTRIADSPFDAFELASKLMFQGAWLKHAGMYPVYQVRLGRRDKLRFREFGHGQRETLPRSSVDRLAEPLVHEAFSKGIAAWMERHNRYASREAEEADRLLREEAGDWLRLFSGDAVERRRAAKVLSWRLPCRGTFRFLYMYFLRLGFLDGGPGLTYCRLLALYETLTAAKLRERRAARRLSRPVHAGMRILLVNQFYPPDVAPTGRFLHDVARVLVERGHTVSALCSRSPYGGGRAMPALSELDGVRVRRLRGGPSGRRSLAGKGWGYAAFTVGLAWRLAAVRPRPDVVVSLTTPPFIGCLGSLTGRVRAWRHVQWIMDLYPDAMVAHGMLRASSLPHRLLAWVARRERLGSALVVCLAPDMAERMTARLRNRRSAPPVRWMPLWAAERLTPWPEGQSVALRTRRGWREDELVLMYSGNMGLGHRFEEFLALAAETCPEDGVRWVFAGDGKRRVEIERFAAEHRDVPLEVLPYVSWNELREHLCSADVHLMSLSAGWQGIIAPSKLQGVLAVGRPLIFVGATDSSPARWIAESGAGWVVPENDLDGLRQAVNEAQDPRQRAERGAAGRRFAETHFNRASNAGRIADWIESLGTKPERSV